jgi:hypothetical protein
MIKQQLQPILLLLVLVLAEYAAARTWRDIDPVHELYPRDLIRSVQFEHDPFEFSPMPSMAPAVPTTKVPTPAPPTRTRDPTTKPTVSTPAPVVRTSPPTLNPTKSPTQSPAFEEYPPNDPPLDPPRGYFNYDVRDTSPYGPGYPALVSGENGFKIEYQNNGWADVQAPFDSYWDEFGSNGFGPWGGVLSSRNMDQNICGTGDEQSPIDIRLSGVACVEHHQIRTRVSQRKDSE